MFGGWLNSKLEMYEDQNGTYELTEELELGKDVSELATDPEWLYFVITTTDPSI